MHYLAQTWVQRVFNSTYCVRMVYTSVYHDVLPSYCPLSHQSRDGEGAKGWIAHYVTFPGTWSYCLFTGHGLTLCACTCTCECEGMCMSTLVNRMRLSTSSTVYHGYHDHRRQLHNAHPDALRAGIRVGDPSARCILECQRLYGFLQHLQL